MPGVCQTRLDSSPLIKTSLLIVRRWPILGNEMNQKILALENLVSAAQDSVAFQPASPCLDPGVEVTVLECLPYAMKLARAGDLERWLLRLRILNQEGYPLAGICPFFVDHGNAGRGECSRQADRPIHCRMSGMNPGELSKMEAKLSGLDFNLGRQKFRIAKAFEMALELLEPLHQADQLPSATENQIGS